MKTSLASRELVFVLRSILLAASLLFLVLTRLVPEKSPVWLMVLVGLGGLCLALLWLSRRGTTRLSSLVLLAATWGLVTWMTFTAGGVHSRAVWSYLIVIPLAGVLLGQRAALAAAGACILSSLIIAGLETLGWLPPNQFYPGAMDTWAILAINIVIVVVLQFLANRNIKESLAWATQELAERQRAEAALLASEWKREELARIEQQRLVSLLHISQKKNGSLMDLLGEAIDEAVALSDSQYGYLFYYDAETTQFTLHAWSSELRDSYHASHPPQPGDLNLTCLWNETAWKSGPVILNDLPTIPQLPENHPSLSRWMSLPVEAGGRIVAVVGVANKAAPYEPEDARQLGLMMEEVWKIAECKQAEVAMRASEEKFRAITEQNSEGIVLIDEEGQVIEWNPAMEVISGIPRSEAVGLLHWDLMFAFSQPAMRTPERYLALQQAVLSALQTGQSNFFGRSVEITLYCPDGRQVAVQQVTFPIKTEVGYRIGSVTRDISEYKQAETQIQALNGKLLQAYDSIIEGWARAMELRHQETEGHSRRVVDMTLKLAIEMGIEDAELAHIRRGAYLHDVGKMGIPDAILLKPGELSVAEWEVMRHHPLYAYELLSNMPFLRPALDIPYYHHERWDGNGYPCSLLGEEIPLAARIFAVVDVWDALLNERPYRPAWPEDEVLEYLRAGAGTQFDPQVVEVFLYLLSLERVMPMLPLYTSTSQ